MYKIDVGCNPKTKTCDSSRVDVGRMREGARPWMYPDGKFQVYFPEIPVLCIVKPKTDPATHVG